MEFFTIPLFVLLAFAACAPLARFAAGDEEDAARVARLLRLALLLRIAIILVFEAVPQTRLFHEDAGGPEWAGPALASYWSGEGPEPTLDLQIGGTSSGSSRGYFYLAGGLCFVFGEHRAVPGLANALFGIATCAFVYRLARVLYGRAVAQWSLPFVAFLPSFVLWSTVATKEASVMLLVSFVVLSFVSGKRDPQNLVLWWGAAGVGIVALFYIRSYVADLLVGAFVLTAFQNSSRSLVANLLVQGFWCLVIVAASFLVFPRAISEVLAVTDVDRVMALRDGLSRTANTGYANEIDLSNMALLPFLLPVALAYFLYSPFPWHLVSMRAWSAMPETVIWWTLAPSVYRGIKEAVRRDYVATAPVLTFVAILSAGYSVTEGNAGVAYRQRTTVVMFLLIFAGLGKHVGARLKAPIPTGNLRLSPREARPLVA